MKLTGHHTCSCNDLTNFEYQVRTKTGNGIYVNLYGNGNTMGGDELHHHHQARFSSNHKVQFYTLIWRENFQKFACTESQFFSSNQKVHSFKLFSVLGGGNGNTMGGDRHHHHHHHHHQQQQQLLLEDRIHPNGDLIGLSHSHTLPHNLSHHMKGKLHRYIFLLFSHKF